MVTFIRTFASSNTCWNLPVLVIRIISFYLLLLLKWKQWCILNNYCGRCLLPVAHFLPSNKICLDLPSPVQPMGMWVENKMHLPCSDHTAVCSYNEDFKSNLLCLICYAVNMPLSCWNHVMKSLKWKVLVCACYISMVRCVNTCITVRWWSLRWQSRIVEWFAGRTQALSHIAVLHFEEICKVSNMSLR